MTEAANFATEWSEEKTLIAEVNAPGESGDEATDEILILPSGNLTITEAAQKIFTRIGATKTVFYRGGCVVEIVQENAEPILSIIRPEEFASRLEHYGQVMAWRVDRDEKSVLKMSRCPSETAKLLLATLEARSLPVITSVVRGPVGFEENGTISLLDNGWHDVAGGTFVYGSAEIEEIDLPTASQTLAELIAEFAFVTPSDRSRAIAAIIAPALKAGGILRGHFPFTIIEADDSQTGKGYLCDLVFAIYGETPGIVGERKGGVGSLDESLAQKLIEGRPFILLDNLRNRIESAFLEAVLTATAPVPARIPHRGEIQISPNSFSFFATSNGVALTKDLANRSNIIRLQKRRDFNFRSYSEGDLLDHVRANRGRFLGAVFAVLRAYVKNGKPRTDDLRGEGRFRHWWQSMDWILQYLLNRAPILDGHNDAQQRTANPVLTWLREICLICENEGRLNEDLSATNIVDISEEHDLPIPGVKGNGEGANKTVGVKLGTLFRESSEITIDRWSVARNEREENTPCGKMRPMKFYRISVRNQISGGTPNAPAGNQVNARNQGNQVI